MGFCSRCGHEVREAESYCSACGLALSPATVASTPPQWPEPADGSAGVRGRAGTTDAPEADLVMGPGGADDSSRSGGGVPRRRLLIGAGLLVLALVGAGAWSAVRDRATGTFFFSSYGEAPLPRPVKAEPEQRWRRDMPTEMGTWVVPGHGVTYISAGVDDTTTTIVAVEDDGTQRWSVEEEANEYAFATSPDGSVLLALQWGYDEESTRPLRALSTADGSLLWTSQDGEPGRITDDGVVLIGDDTIKMVDIHDGSAVWSLGNGNGLSLNSELVVVSDHDTLTAYDITSGEEAWATDEGFPCAGVTICRIAASDDVVVVKGGIDAVAYDPAHGERLWSERVDEAQDVGVAARGLVYLQTQPDSDTPSDVSIVFYDHDGRRGELALRSDQSWFFPVGMTTAGGSFVLDWASGTVYDDQLAEVMQIDGDLALTGGGVYALDGDDLSYHRFDRSDPVWAMQVDGEPTSAQSGDGTIVVTWDGAIALYR
jgi:hypothetical protein